MKASQNHGKNTRSDNTSIRSNETSNIYGNFKSFWEDMPRNQKSSFIAITIIAVLIIPVTTIVSQYQTRINSRAQNPVTPITPITPPTNSTPTPSTQCVPTNGDSNGDGKATPNDFSFWAFYFDPFNTISGGPAVGDFNCDGRTNANDFSIWAYYFVPF